MQSTSLQQACTCKPRMGRPCMHLQVLPAGKFRPGQFWEQSEKTTEFLSMRWFKHALALETRAPG